MHVIVQSVSKEHKSIYDDGYLNTQVIFKAADKYNDAKYKLNLSTRHKDVVSKWKQNLQKGNVLNVSLLPNGVNVNPFASYEVIKSVNTAGIK